MKTWSRKDFLKASLIGGGAAFVAGQTRLYGQVAGAAGSANGDIRVAVVGINAQGAGHMRDYLNKLPGSRLVAICDVDSDVLAKRAAECEKAGVKVETYVDYRKLLENKNIDAVVLASPNHQHSLQTIWGLQAGKDVYCEKPLSHNVWEGRQAVAAAKKYSKNIVMAGTQNRSSLDIQEAISILRAGKLGEDPVGARSVLQAAGQHWQDDGPAKGAGQHQLRSLDRSGGTHAAASQWQQGSGALRLALVLELRWWRHYQPRHPPDGRRALDARRSRSALECGELWRSLWLSRRCRDAQHARLGVHLPERAVDF